MKTLIRITTSPVSLKKLLDEQLKYMSSHYRVIAVSSPGAELDWVGEKYNIEVRQVPMTRRITPFKDVIALIRLYLLFKRLAPDIVHSHTPKAGLLAMLAGKCSKVPKRIHTVAGLPLMESKGLKYQLLVFIERITYRYATSILPVSFNLLKYIQNNIWNDDSRMKVLGNGSSNGIDLDFFKPSDEIRAKSSEIKAEFGISDNDFVFLMIGRIVRDKGVNELIIAFDNLCKAYPNLVLLLVGPREDDLNPISEESRLLMDRNPKIKLGGYRDDVRPFFVASHVFILPSYREGFPNVVLQASAMGVPSIVTNINGSNEIIQNGVNGLIVESKDVQGLQSAMEYFILNTEKCVEMGSVSRELITGRFDREYLWNEILKEYNTPF